MSSPKLNMPLQLWHAECLEFFHPSYFADLAQILDTEINRPEVREWIEAGPMSPTQYTRLRYLLMALRKSKVVEPRRLTWLERITGRLKP